MNGAIVEQIKKYGIFAMLFCSLLFWTINNYEKREALYMKHEDEYHTIISNAQAIMKENQIALNDAQKTLDGFRMILDVRLNSIENVIKELCRKGGN